MSTPLTLTREEVRRLAIVRQHLADPTPAPMLDLIRDLGCLQLDPIRAVERTHLLVLWSRLGAFDEAELEHLRWEDRALFEYWCHAASLVLTEEYPVHRWHMGQKRHSNPRADAWFAETEGLDDLRDYVLQRVKQEGPLHAREFENPEHMVYDTRWSSGRYVNYLLDLLWSQGHLVIAGRPSNHRQWGLADQFWPAWTPQEEWNAEQVCRFATQKAIRALGAATPKQIKFHYTRGRYPNLNAVLKKLVGEGTLHEVVVTRNSEPLPGPWYIHSDDLPLLARLRANEWHPRTTLLSPFDNLICDRDRTEQLFDFFYRIEIYVPAAKREYGYYVLPILHGDQLIGRVDPKMDRQSNTLYVNAVYAEESSPDDEETVTAVRSAITDLASFLGATNINWGECPAQWRGLRE